MQKLAVKLNVDMNYNQIGGFTLTKKRWMRFALFVVVAMMVLTACSGNSETDDQVAGNSTGSNDSSTADNTGSSDNGNGTSKVVSFEAFASKSNTISDLNDNLLTRKVEEMFNIDIEFVTVPQEGAKEKQNLLLVSGDYPPVFMGGSFSTIDQLKYGNLGVLIPLNDLIEKHGPNIKKVFEDKPYVKDAITAPDGNIYGLPRIEECYHCGFPQKLWINTVWLDNLGLEIPTTTEELEQVLLAFKNDDPNGNGKPDEIALSGANDLMGEPIGFFMNAFIYDNELDFLELNDGIVDFVADDPEWKQGLAYIKKLYDQGLIDPQAFTQNREGLMALGDHPDEVILGAFMGSHMGKGITTNETNDSRWKQYIALPPVKGPDGVQLTGSLGGEVSDAMFAITDKATEEQQIAAIKLADYFYTLDGTMDNNSGVKGVGWVEAASGEVGPTGKQAVYKISEEARANPEQPRNWAWRNLRYQPSELSEMIVSDPQGYGAFLTQQTKNYEPYAPKEKVPSRFFVEEDQVQVLAQRKTDITNYVLQNTIQFITGGKDLNRDWDSYVQGYKGLGLEEYILIHQQVVDRNK